MKMQEKNKTTRCQDPVFASGITSLGSGKKLKQKNSNKQKSLTPATAALTSLYSVIIGWSKGNNRKSSRCDDTFCQMLNDYSVG